METKTPIVSVIIPTHNRPALLPTALKSVLDQTFQDFEIIVVDDGTKVRAKEVVQTIKDDRIKYIVHETNRGCAAAKNTGAYTARGKYIAILDDDDMWLPLKLEKQVHALESAPKDVALCFTAAYECFSDKELVAACPEGVANYHETVLRDFSAIHGSMVMYRREAFLAIGGMNEQYPTHTDVEFLLRFTRKYRGIGINEPLVRRKIEDEHVQMGSNIHNRIKGRHMILEEFGDEFRKYPPFLAKHTERLAKFYRQVGDFRNARKYFMKSFRLQPRIIRFLYICTSFWNGALYRGIVFLKRN